MSTAFDMCIFNNGKKDVIEEEHGETLFGDGSRILSIEDGWVLALKKGNIYIGSVEPVEVVTDSIFLRLEDEDWVPIEEFANDSDEWIEQFVDDSDILTDGDIETFSDSIEALRKIFYRAERYLDRKLFTEIMDDLDRKTEAVEEAKAKSKWLIRH